MGISYAVVTKVKELTETRQYGEALDLLDGEDIFQSLNPQFLRCCGKVYLENDRFYESREALVRAHVMAPEGNRIVYDLVHLYLKMGYFHRAQRYYEIYVHNAGPEDNGKYFLNYMIQKAQRVEAEKLLTILEQACEENYSDEWGFELALLYASLGMQSKMKEECIHLMASFRNSPYCSLAEDLKKGQYDTSNSYFRFPIMEAEEDLETYASIISMEEQQLEKDDLRIHPPAPVILQMEDDDGTEKEPEKDTIFKIKFPFGKKHDKVAEEKKEQNTPSAEADDLQDAIEEKAEPENVIIPPEEEQEENTSESEDNVSSYIASVMESVADIEASVEEDLQNPAAFTVKHETQSELTPGERTETEPHTSDGSTYQPKLLNIEENLSPKERLEQLMKLIEEDRVKEEQNTQEIQTQEEELDLDEFLMDLVGANSITQAMVKSYRDEKNPKD